MPGGVRVRVHLGIGADPLVASSAVGWRVRDMVPGDLDRVMAIEEVSFPTPWSRSMFAEDLERPFSSPVVAEGPDGGLYGYAVCWNIAGESHLLNIAVRPDRRGEGIGRALVGECIRRGALAGSTLIHLEVRVGNEEAQRLYFRCGFEIRGIRKRYYTDTGEDAVLLSRGIGGSDAD